MNKKKIFRVILSVWIVLILIITDTYSQPPAPPGGNGWNGNQGPGGFAPAEGGLILMILSSIFYGLVRIFRALVHKNDKPNGQQ